MSDRSHQAALEETYQHFWPAHDGEGLAGMEDSPPPRPPVMLFDLARELGVGAANRVLDLGCGRGNHALALAQRSDCRVIGIDPVQGNLGEAARAAVQSDGEHMPVLAGAVSFLSGGMESLPFRGGVFDLIWSRGVLVHVWNLARGLSECRRVLKQGGVMVVETSVATDQMEPREAARLYGPLSIRPKNMSRGRVEKTFRAAGFQIHSCVPMGGEPMEYFEETEGRCSKEFARLAKLVRAREEIVARVGKTHYEVTLATHQWIIYHLLGKLSTVLYSLKTSPGQR